MRFYTSLFILVAALLCGCSYTYNSGGLGRTSPDGRFELGFECDGAYGHAYDDKTKKKIWVWIGSGSGTNYTLLFRHFYVVTGSDIEWQTHWSSSEAVSVEI